MFVFGYGSLLWKQGFEHVEVTPGYIKGFKRRFWQGSEDHRGSPGKPGRVLTVIKSDDPEEKVWGLRFKIAPEKEEWTRSYLTERETGYDAVMTSFYPVHKDMLQAGEATELQVFIADQSMDYYLGEAGDRDIAWQIYHAKGMSGTNLEYFIKLLIATRAQFPAHCDQHLDKIEDEIYKIASEKGENMDTYIRV